MADFISKLKDEYLLLDQAGTLKTVILAVAAVLVVFILIAAISAAKLKRDKIHAKNVIKQTMLAIAETIDAKDTYAKGHSKRVAEYSIEIGKRIGYKDLDALYYIALMHDIGNVGIPDDILMRDGRLLPDEYAVMMNHTEIGSTALSSIADVQNINYGAKYHHEHFDGSGYNEGLKGEDIPIEGRIVGLADAFDAMTSERSYRPGLNKTDAIVELRRCSGSQFDPYLADMLINALNSGFNPIEK